MWQHCRTWGMILTIFSKLQGWRKILHLIFSLNHDDNMPLSLKCIVSTSDAIFWTKKVIKHTSAIQPIKDVFVRDPSHLVQSAFEVAVLHVRTRYWLSITKKTWWKVAWLQPRFTQPLTTFNWTTEFTVQEISIYVLCQFYLFLQFFATDTAALEALIQLDSSRSPSLPSSQSGVRVRDPCGQLWALPRHRLSPQALSGTYPVDKEDWTQEME